MGTMGSCAWTARWKAPFLKGRSEGVGEAERVPSGKMKSDNFFKLCESASSNFGEERERERKHTDFSFIV